MKFAKLQATELTILHVDGPKMTLHLTLSYNFPIKLNVFVLPKTPLMLVFWLQGPADLIFVN